MEISEIKLERSKTGLLNQPFIDITKISHELKSSGLSQIDNLSDLTIPLRLPVSCDIIYDALRPVAGNRVQVFINGKLIDEINYSKDFGKKYSTEDISEHLNEGLNELRFKCLITTDHFYENSDCSTLVIRSDGSTIIRKAYTTNSSLEPIDQIWMLRLID